MLFDETNFGSYGQAEQNAREAFELYDDGDMVEALVEIDQAIKINPANANWHFNRGLILDSLGRFDEAAAAYEHAMELNPDDLEILNSLAVDYTRGGFYDRALGLFEHIQRLDPDYEPSYCNRIITYTEMERHDKAEEMFYLAQQIKPDCALCFYNIGNNLFVRGEYEKTLCCWKKTLRYDPDHPQINYRIAQAYWASDHLDESVEYFLKELRIDPGKIDVLIDFGVLLLQMGQIDSAREKFHRVCELVPHHAQAVFYLGEIEFNNKHYEQAQHLYSLAFDFSGHSLAGANYRLGQCQLLAGNKSEAVNYLLCEISLSPKDSVSLTSMGAMLMELEQFDSANNCFLKAIDYDSSNKHAFYYLGILLASNDRLTEAVEFLTCAVDLDDKFTDAFRQLAMVYMSMGHYDQAAGQIAQAAKSISNQNSSDSRQIKKLSRKIHRACTLEHTKARLGSLLHFSS